MKKSINKKVVIKIYSGIIFVLSIIILNSCSDALGVDPNVRITEIEEGGNNNDTGGTKKPNKFAINSLWNFSEYFEENAKGKSFIWGKDMHEVRKQFYIDSSNSQTAIWINYEAYSTEPDQRFKFRRDRVDRFYFSVDSLVLDFSKINDNYAFYQNVNFKIEIRNIRDNKIITLNKNDLGFSFFLRKNQNNGNIEGIITIDFMPFFKFDTFKFQGIFEAIMP
jgi:hypothetical protein